MRKTGLLFLFILFSSSLLNAQVLDVSVADNPVLHSIPIGEERLKNYSLSSNYYPLKGNIENPSSSVFISENPTSNQALKSAIALFPHFFVLSDQSGVRNMIMLSQRKDEGEARFYFIVMDLKTQEWKEYACDTPGEIAEYRAEELDKQKYASKSRVKKRGKKHLLIYEGETYEVQTYLDMKKELIKLIETELLDL